MTTASRPRAALLGLAALVLSLVSAFFVFYTARLLIVTHGLRTLRPGGGGAYVGAVVFPLLALACAWAAMRCVRALRAART